NHHQVANVCGKRSVIPAGCAGRLAGCELREEASMSRPARRLSVAAALPFACVLDMVFAGPASAHIKWVCVYDVASQPVGLENVLCRDFELLTGLSLLGLLTGCAAEGTVVGNGILRAFDQATSVIRDNLEIIFRAACAFFFISIWAVGGILLTPELKTDSIWI